MRVLRDGKAVRLLTCNGHDWTDRYPGIVETARKIREQQLVIDDEAVVLDLRGISGFRKRCIQASTMKGFNSSLSISSRWAAMISAGCLSACATNLAQLLARRPEGIFVAPFEQGEIGPDLFRAACNMGLEGLVSKQAQYHFTDRQRIEVQQTIRERRNARRLSSREPNKSAMDFRFCEGFRMTAHGDGSASTGAVVRKPPGKEPAGDELPTLPRALWRFDRGVDG